MRNQSNVPTSTLANRREPFGLAFPCLLRRGGPETSEGRGAHPCPGLSHQGQTPRPKAAAAQGYRLGAGADSDSALMLRGQPTPPRPHPTGGLPESLPSSHITLGGSEPPPSAPLGSA
ncbi:unnamed protein product [Pipistrellus nathusii]|uniref:Uncharacterized protein n=1 Tax=Pipistrellus nathusii TaxID=59473 RepID=A0ABP0AHB0_PIPNA